MIGAVLDRAASALIDTLTGRLVTIPAPQLDASDVPPAPAPVGPRRLAPVHAAVADPPHPDDPYAVLDPTLPHGTFRPCPA